MARHEKVSVDEIREKRLAAQAQAAEGNESAPETPTTPLDGQQFGGSPDAPPSVIDQQATSEAAPTPPTAVSSIVVPIIPDLESMLASLSPDQLAKLRVIAAAKGVQVPTSQSVGNRNPNGSMDVNIHLEPEVVEQLVNWSEPGGMTVVEAAQKYISEALVAFLYGDWNPTPEPVAEPVAAAVTK